MRAALCIYVQGSRPHSLSHAEKSACSTATASVSASSERNAKGQERGEIRPDLAVNAIAKTYVLMEILPAFHFMYYKKFILHSLLPYSLVCDILAHITEIGGYHMTNAQIFIMVTMILYLCFVIVTGVLIGRRTKKSSEGFYLGGRGIGPIVTAMSAEASDMSSYLLMGVPGLAYLSGLADASWTAIGLSLGTYLNFLLVARRLRRYSERLDAITIPSFISRRFHEKTPVIMCISALIILIFFIPYVSSGLVAIGKLFNSLFGWNYMTAVIIGAVVIISYTTVGGFKAVATMDLIQSIIMTISLCVIVCFAIHHAGGWSAVVENAGALPGYLEFFKTYNPSTGTASPYGFITIVSTMAWGLGYFGMPHILVRFMAIRNENELKYSRRIAGVWVVISMGIAVLIGVIGYAVSCAGRIEFLEGNATENVIVKLASLLSSYGPLAAVIAGLTLAAILAATMSTADSQLLAAASAFSENLLQNVFGRKLSEKQNMLAARITVIVIACISIFLARNPDSNIFKIVSFAWAGFGATFGPAILFALFWKRCNRQGIIAGLIAGAVSIFVWKFGIRPLGGAWNIYELLPAFLVNSVFTVIVSLITPAPEKEVTDVFEEVNA